MPHRRSKTSDLKWRNRKKAKILEEKIEQRNKYGYKDIVPAAAVDHIRQHMKAGDR